MLSTYVLLYFQIYIRTQNMSYMESYVTTYYYNLSFLIEKNLINKLNNTNHLIVIKLIGIQHFSETLRI